MRMCKFKPLHLSLLIEMINDYAHLISISFFFSLQGLKNVTVIEGESVTLECHISGYPSPKVTWYREDYQIESSIDFQVTFQSGIARLMIREAFAEDSGRFTCSAVNEAGTVSTSCYLAVQGWWPHSHRLLYMPSPSADTSHSMVSACLLTVAPLGWGPLEGQLSC